MWPEESKKTFDTPITQFLPAFWLFSPATTSPNSVVAQE